MDEINFEYYRMFCVVAESGSFSEAAERLYVSQPAVTQAIRRLEQSLKGKLFVRNARGIVLTDEGKRFYNYIKPSVDTMNNAENKFSQYINLEEGEIKIKTGSALGNVGIYDAIIEFSKKYPKINISVSGGYVGDSIESLSRGEVDLVAVNLPYECNKPNIQIIKCKQIEDCFFASREYWENIKDEDEIIELLKTELIVPAEKSTTGTILKKILAEMNIEHIPKFTMTSTNARKYLVSKGLGIGFAIKDNIKNELESGKLVEIKVVDKPLIRDIGVAVQGDEMISNATLKLVEMMKNM